MSGGSEGCAGGANYPAGKIPWHMPANNESRGDAPGFAVGVSITFQQDVNWISFSLLDLYLFPSLSFSSFTSLRYRVCSASMAAYFISNLLRRLIAVLRFFC